MKCIINQGLPGSGKSRSVKEHLDAGHVGHTVVCSADDYHMVDGEYTYTLENAGAAHAACFAKFELATRKHVVQSKDESRKNYGGFTEAADFVFVDNTSMALWEMYPYVQLANLRGYEVEVRTFLCSVDVAVERNVHAVPWHRIINMASRLEYPPPFWDCTHVIRD